MKKPYLTVKTFYEEVNKRKKDKKNLIKFFQNLEKNYTIPNVIPPDMDKCPIDLPDSYIVNNSKKRYHNELDRSHFLIHWGYLCHFQEVAETLKYVYNKIKSNRTEIINTIYNISNVLGQKEILLDAFLTEDSHLKHHYIKLNNALGFGNIPVVRIKITNQTPDSIPNLNDPYEKKMTINLSVILKLSKKYPRNLIACPIDKTIVADRHQKIKRIRYNFVCHPDNMTYRLETDNILLSVWLIKTLKMNKDKTRKRWESSIIMGTAYLSETFPSENGTVNDFIGESRKNGFQDESAKYWKKIEDAVDLNEFYAVETIDPLAKNLSVNSHKSVNSVNSHNSHNSVKSVKSVNTKKTKKHRLTQTTNKKTKKSK
jgi:hypothetical protein